MNQTRQGLAMAIGIYAISQLSKNRDIKFIFFIIFASLFHLSALLYLILLILKKFPLSKKVVVLYILCTIVAVFGYDLFVKILIHTKYGLYFGTFYDQKASLSTIVNLIIRIVFLLFVLYYYPQIRRNYKEDILYHMALLCTSFQTLTVISSTFGRITSLFFLSYIILIPKIVYGVKKNKILRLECYLGATLYQIVYYMIMNTSVLVNQYKSVVGNIFND